MTPHVMTQPVAVGVGTPGGRAGGSGSVESTVEGAPAAGGWEGNPGRNRVPLTRERFPDGKLRYRFFV